jgi:hypothetical protein
MQLRIASDLHIEGKPLYDKYPDDPLLFSGHFLPVAPNEDQQTLILAGDITSKLANLELIFEQASKRFNRVIYVPGNHERYWHDFDEWTVQAENLKLKFPNIFAAMDGVERIELDGVRFIYGTLWTLGGRDLTECQNVQDSLNDFYLIRYNGGVFSVSSMIDKCNKQIDLIDTYLAEPTECHTTVVVTHHLPSFKFCAARFGGRIDGGFASNFDDVIKTRKPDYWVFGHTHDTIQRKLYGTMFICNPAGYPGEYHTQHNQYIANGPLVVSV